MRETDWADSISEQLSKAFPKYRIETGKRLTYAHEIREYTSDQSRYQQMKYETDLLIQEETRTGDWIPRVVIETKLRRISSHAAITYSQKAASHKQVHPYLRYGIFIGDRGTSPLPGRLFRHGAHFDFMLSWKSHKSNAEERKELVRILRHEIKASKTLEKLLYESRKKNRDRLFSFHKPLRIK